jgi:HEAT repeat protein
MAAATGRMAALICACTGIALSVTPVAQSRSVKDLIAGLGSQDPPVRARAACELKDEGDMAVDAIAPLVQLLADASPVERSVCKQHWWQQSDLLTTPGQQAAAALVSIGNRTFDPLVSALHQPQWVARRNAAWALGALDDSRAVNALVAALDDREPDVRAQAAWALGAIGDRAAVERLTAALKDADARVRKQSAWALGAIGDSRATEGLVAALKDTDPGVRRQAAWALGAIGR